MGQREVEPETVPVARMKMRLEQFSLLGRQLSNLVLAFGQAGKADLVKLADRSCLLLRAADAAEPLRPAFSDSASCILRHCPRDSHAAILAAKFRLASVLDFQCIVKPIILIIGRYLCAEVYSEPLEFQTYMQEPPK